MLFYEYCRNIRKKAAGQQANEVLFLNAIAIYRYRSENSAAEALSSCQITSKWYLYRESALEHLFQRLLNLYNLINGCYDLRYFHSLTL